MLSRLPAAFHLVEFDQTPYCAVEFRLRFQPIYDDLRVRSQIGVRVRTSSLNNGGGEAPDLFLQGVDAVLTGANFDVDSFAKISKLRFEFLAELIVGFVRWTRCAGRVHDSINGGGRSTRVLDRLQLLDLLV